VVNFVILVLVGGGLGAVLREFVMLMVPNPVDGFPLDILVANLLHARSCHGASPPADPLRRRQYAARSRHHGWDVDVFELCLRQRRVDAGLRGKRCRCGSLCGRQSGLRLHRNHCRREAWRTSSQVGSCGSGRRLMSLDRLLLSPVLSARAGRRRDPRDGRVRGNPGGGITDAEAWFV
jgi:hypothetical protein